MRGQSKPRAVLPSVPAAPATGHCWMCARGYLRIQEDFRELATVLRSVDNALRRYEELHGHQFSGPKLVLEAAHCDECHAVGAFWSGTRPMTSPNAKPLP
jgi:hypothetical protein